MHRTVGPFVLATAFGAFLTAGLAPASQDIEGAGDHPDVPRVAGSYIVYHDVTDFDRLTVPTGPYTGEGFESTAVMEGEVLSQSYVFDDPSVATLRVKRSYIHALEDSGFDILYTGSEAELSGGDGRTFFIQSGLFERGARDCCRVANRDRQVRYIAARSGSGEVLAAIAIYNARGVDGPAVSKAIVTAEEMATAMEHKPLTAGEMETGLVEDGRVAIQNILFAVNSAEILPDSADALEAIAELMSEQPDLTLLVVGHTDSTGDYDYNLTLSMERAEAVVRWLQREHGIDGDRLQAAGAGMMAPVTSNRTEAGRAENRRVELVERNP
ncbi:OmpA family protein [Alkalilimnicola ehrlichii MLHE-1]|uniref:OmpA/MotB domain protein n=1 Tax=Alkalilimnicola ehrlichii (strain ATCC BAA-1101 / DSM 17681 / MLHE-1) TaxID=187272 RepID=Q0A8S7_ALKEH|nr:OmpA family protein [Alkalilimnicola ehrlichii]ABI56760.1 OmpA/MotB domain protein [Alkalilimnicola ehrlichii MLHE-1]